MIEALAAKQSPLQQRIASWSDGLGGLTASSCTSPQGVFHFRGGLDGRLGRWCVDSQSAELKFIELPTLRGLNAWISKCVCLPDGKHVVAADSWGQLAGWEFCSESTEPVWKIANAHDGWIRDLDVSPDGRCVASCGRDGRIVCWSNDGQRKREIIAGGDLSFVHFAPDGRSIEARSRAGLTSRWTL